MPSHATAPAERRQGAAAATRLPALAEQINREHGLCRASWRDSLQHALIAGRLLTEAKAQVPHGEWLDWLRTNFDGSERAAQGYMRLAREPNPQRVADTSLRQALQALANRRRRRLDERARERAVPDVEARAERGAVEDHDRRERFPRPGVERKTWRDIEAALAEAEHKRRMPAKTPTLVPDAKADLLLEAKDGYERAAEALGELAQFVRSYR
jgi:hypothetical protein